MLKFLIQKRRGDGPEEKLTYNLSDTSALQRPMGHTKKLQNFQKSSKIIFASLLTHFKNGDQGIFFDIQIFFSPKVVLNTKKGFKATLRKIKFFIE